MVTTIQLNEDVKKELDRIKLTKESYEQVIVKLMKIVESYQREHEQLLIPRTIISELITDFLTLVIFSVPLLMTLLVHNSFPDESNLDKNIL